MTMGEKILNMRKARGWSQEELAERIGVTRQAVSRWESNSAKPDADKIVAVCDLFGVSADYLLREGYPGEGMNPVKDVQMNPRFHVLTGKQILGFATFALGLLTLIVLEIVCAINPHTLHAENRVYKGLDAYIRVYDLEWIIWLLWLLIGIGILLAVWDRLVALVKKLKKIANQNKG